MKHFRTACLAGLLLVLSPFLSAAGLFLLITVVGTHSASLFYFAPPAQAASASSRKDAVPILGVWQGTTLAACGGLSLPNRCDAQEQIKITLFENPGSEIDGLYKCSYGNMDCYHQNDSGKVVDAQMNGQELSMRVIMLDGTSCRFVGRVRDNQVNGGYSCFSGASQFEQGTWRARHSY